MSGWGSGPRAAVADDPVLVARIRELRDRGLSLRAIADQLTAEGIPTRRGGTRWRASALQVVLNGIARSPESRERERSKQAASRAAWSPTYGSWRAMMMRCYHPGHTAFPRYGGQGITVCERWHSFEAFLEDMGERPQGRTLDRIDTERNYEPGNCRWATHHEQRVNQRRMRAAAARNGSPASGGEG